MNINRLRLELCATVSKDDAVLNVRTRYVMLDAGKDRLSNLYLEG